MREQLQSLNLAGVGVTAAIDAEGKLRKVGGLWQKLLGEATQMGNARLLHTVILAEEQDDVPEEFLLANAEPFRVLKARTFAEAIQLLHEHALPWRAVQEYELSKCQTLMLLQQPMPMATHYRALPLLREVKREKLLRDPRQHERNEDEPADEDFLPHSAHIVRWEEEVRSETVSYDRVELLEAFTNFRTAVNDAKLAITDTPRFAVLGPPGSGKTTLTEYLTWRVASGELLINGRNRLPVRVRLRDWERWAEKGNRSLADCLAQAYAQTNRKHMPTAEQFQYWMQRGDLVLLLDGLDELAQGANFAEAIRDALAAAAACPVVLACRTVSFEQHKAVCPDFPVFTIDGLEEEERDHFIRAYPATASYNAEGLIAQLNETHTMQPLAANPLLLAIICYVTASGVKLPAKRAELYDKAINKLLSQPRKGAVVTNDVVQQMSLTRNRRILEHAALHLFAGTVQQRALTFDEATLLAALKDDISDDQADALLQEYTHNSGLIRGNAEQGYFFLHPTIHEFLTASALARLVNKQGWDAVITVGKKQVTVYHLIDRKAWAVEWEEVILLLAGLLDAPELLLEMLANENSDDYFRHRLALAARCLGELKRQRLAQAEKISNQITSEAYYLWQGHYNQSMDQAFPQLERTLQALWLANGKIEDCSLHEYLYRNLRSEMQAIEVIGSMAATPEIVTLLGVWLRDQDEEIRHTAMRGIQALGEKAGTPEIVTQLEILMQDQIYEIRMNAIQTIKALGKKAATSRVLGSVDKIR